MYLFDSKQMEHLSSPIIGSLIIGDIIIRSRVTEPFIDWFLLPCHIVDARWAHLSFSRNRQSADIFTHTTGAAGRLGMVVVPYFPIYAPGFISRWVAADHTCTCQPRAGKKKDYSLDQLKNRQKETKRRRI